MWWFIRKKVDDESQIVYSYGFETKEVSGEVKYDRLSHKFEILRLADNDSEKIAKRFLFEHLYRAITKENCPDERQIAIG